jgi:hypothetical protein
MSASHQPGLDEIEACFVAVLEGRMSRDGADRWAGHWSAADDLVWDEVSWWALGRLHGIDLPAGPSGDFLHDDAQVRAWLVELRDRRGA